VQQPQAETDKDGLPERINPSPSCCHPSPGPRKALPSPSSPGSCAGAASAAELPPRGVLGRESLVLLSAVCSFFLVVTAASQAPLEALAT
jgi:hypothetical protein